MTRVTRSAHAAATCSIFAAVVACAAATEPRPAACDARASDVLASVRRDSVPQPASSFRTIDDESADVARQAPGGYAGIYRDDAGRLVVLLRDTTDVAATLRALTPLLAALYGGRLGPLDGAQVVKTRWDFAQLQDWYRYLQPRVWLAGEVTVTDIDEVRNQLMFGVRDEGARSAVESVLRTLDVPCGLVSVKVAAPVIAY